MKRIITIVGLVAFGVGYYLGERTRTDINSTTIYLDPKGIGAL